MVVLAEPKLSLKEQRKLYFKFISDTFVEFINLFIVFGNWDGTPNPFSLLVCFINHNWLRVKWRQKCEAVILHQTSIPVPEAERCDDEAHL